MITSPNYWYVIINSTTSAIRINIMLCIWISITCEHYFVCDLSTGCGIYPNDSTLTPVCLTVLTTTYMTIAFTMITK